MVPVTLTLSGFLSYKDPVTLDFTAFDLACIAGPNGAGKSSLLDGLTYALFGKARKADETLINLASDSAFVELVFDYEGSRYRVQRTNPKGKSTILEFQIDAGENGQAAWKPLTQRTVRDTQRTIEETLRLDYDTFTNAAFFLQNKADQFTQQTPSRRKAILGSILGLDIWETYRQGTFDRRRKIESEVHAIDGRLAEIQKELNEEDERVELLKSLNVELERLVETRKTQEKLLESIRKVQAGIEEQERFVKNLDEQSQAARRRVEEMQTRIKSRRAERDEIAGIREREAEIRRSYEALTEARARLETWDAAASEHEAKRRAPLLEIEKTRVRIESELEQLAASEKKARGTGEAVELLEKEIAGLRESLAPLAEQLAARAALEAELTETQARLAEAQAENPRLKQEMEDLRARIDQLEHAPESESVCPLCGQPLTLEHRAELIETLTGDGKAKGDQFRANTTLMKTVDAQFAELKKQIQAISAVEKEHRRLSDALLLKERQLADQEAVLAAWEADGLPRLAALSAELEGETFAPEARASLAEIDAALKETGYDAAEHDRVRKVAADGGAVEESMRRLEVAAAALEPLERELGELEKELAGAETELAEREAALAEARETLAAAKGDAPDVRQAQRDLLDSQEQENRLRMKVGSAQQNVDVLAGLKERAAGLEGERSGMTVDIAAHKQLERAFSKDGVPALLIEQAIPQIESKANEILERLSGGEMSVRFQTQRALKSSDSLRETLDITISDRAGVRDYEMYSGGEAFRVDFAVRLALSEILARRAGARLQTLVIDEGFGSQDEAGRQRLIEAINLVRGDFQKVLVITHIEELKDAFPARIEVEKGEGGSRVTVIDG